MSIHKRGPFSAISSIVSDRAPRPILQLPKTQVKVMALEISPFKEKEILAKVVVKANANWSQPTTVLRLLSASSVEYCVYLTEKAIDGASLLEHDRIYRITVPAKTVKMKDAGPAKYFGMDTDVTIRCKFPLKCSLATPADAASFGGNIAYKFVPLSTLNQADDGSYVDIHGRVTNIDNSQLCNTLPKKTLTIANGDFYETVELLGMHASLDVTENVVVACKGLVLKTWKGSRTCSTTLLSYILLNPDASVGRVADPSSEESPQKKATMAKNCPRMTTLLIQDAADKMKTDYEQRPEGPLPTFPCMLRGHLTEITMESLANAPIYEKTEQAGCASERTSPTVTEC